ncbi:MAG TPA: hypothetical protein PKM73_05760 [Verrucomicrobiota bacterium]|nr:hypothetical protein [Verrucomicrobiota bacterium]
MKPRQSEDLKPRFSLLVCGVTGAVLWCALCQQTTFKPGQGQKEVWVGNKKAIQYPDEFREYGTNVYNIRFAREWRGAYLGPCPLPGGQMIGWRRFIADFGGGSVIEASRESAISTVSDDPVRPTLILHDDVDKAAFLEREQEAKRRAGYYSGYSGSPIVSFGLFAGYTNWNSNRIPVYDVGKLLSESEGRRRMAENALAERKRIEKAKQGERSAIEARTVEFLKARAKDGSAEASYDLGTRYLVGKGVEKDVPEAKRHFKRAAEQGHQAARAELGRLEKVE